MPGWVAEHHVDVIAAVAAQGREVGHHGYLQEIVADLSPEEERTVLERGLVALYRVVGEQPIGYRSPSWDCTARTLDLLGEFDFRYSSTLMSHFLSWQHPASTIIELPVS